MLRWILFEMRLISFVNKEFLNCLWNGKKFVKVLFIMYHSLLVFLLLSAVLYNYVYWYPCCSSLYLSSQLCTLTSFTFILFFLPKPFTIFPLCYAQNQPRVSIQLLLFYYVFSYSPLLVPMIFLCKFLMKYYS